MTHLRWILVLLLVSSMGLFGCGDTTDDGPSPDDENASAFPAGKADSQWTSCELDAAVMLVNNPATDASLLRELGVHSRAAKNLIKTRDGADEIAGTEDDLSFADIETIDAVKYVGPVALGQIVDATGDACVGYSPAAETIMSPQLYADSHLARARELIEGAQRSVDVAMYSFRDSGIREALGDAVARGVAVRVIFEGANKDRKNPDGSSSAKIEDLGIDVRYVNKIMHHKFMIVDGPQTSPYEAFTTTVFSGSGNWSSSAGTRYDENTAIITGNAEMALLFQREFNHVWRNSRDFVWDDTLAFVETMPIEDWMFVDDGNMDAAFTSANFDIKDSSRYGKTFSVVAGRNTAADAIVARIATAESSIYIASGHLRSRPVSEALMARAAEVPDLDVRVYLDGQEFISAWYHGEQELKLADCLVVAADNTKKAQDCLDRGFYFGYSLVQAGIDVRFKHYAYRWHYSYAPQMHHKYLIIDNNTVISGSYNLSDNAEHNTLENTVFYERDGFPQLVDAFIANFETLWVTGEADMRYEGLLDNVQNGTSAIPIVYPAMAITWQQVDTLKAALKEHCLDINDYDMRRFPERYRTCERDPSK